MNGILIQKTIKKKQYFMFQPISIKNDSIPLNYRHMPFLKTNFQHFKFDIVTKDTNKPTIRLDNLSVNIKDLLHKIKIGNIYEKKKKKFLKLKNN